MLAATIATSSDSRVSGGSSTTGARVQNAIIATKWVHQTMVPVPVAARNTQPAWRRPTAERTRSTSSITAAEPTRQTSSAIATR